MVFVVPTSVARRNPRPGVAFRPVRDVPDCTLAVAWSQEAHSPVVAAVDNTYSQANGGVVTGIGNGTANSVTIDATTGRRIGPTAASRQPSR
ncbi:hypothetical protein ABZ307_43205 [Streptomyces griseorubiginosus]|uniref:hypothetical protein n=1 Tax=Streptomyces griseorubiginosus TaxID=67304 RepID=UPI0033BE9F28